MLPSVRRRALRAGLGRQSAAREPTFAEPDYALVHQELKKKGVTLTLLWEEYRQAVGDRGYQYTAFCTRYRDWAGKLKRSMRQIHRAGEKLFADYAGPTVPIVDASTGEICPASTSSWNSASTQRASSADAIAVSAAWRDGGSAAAAGAASGAARVGLGGSVADGGTDGEWGDATTS